MKRIRWINCVTFALLFVCYAYFLLTLKSTGVSAIVSQHWAFLPLLFVISLVVQLIKATRMYIIMIDTKPLLRGQPPPVRGDHRHTISSSPIRLASSIASSSTAAQSAATSAASYACSPTG
jgi:hypothetical protein